NGYFPTICLGKKRVLQLFRHTHSLAAWLLLLKGGIALGTERQSTRDTLRDPSNAGSPLPTGRGGAVRSSCCPRCGGELRYPGVLDACISCGYSRGGNNGPVSAEPPAATGKPVPSRALLEVMRNVPPWAWLLVGGCLAILVVCSVISLVLPSEGL